MRNLIVMFVTAVCFLFLLKLAEIGRKLAEKNKNFYDVLLDISSAMLILP